MAAIPDLYSIGAEEVGLFTPQNVLDDMNIIKEAADNLDKMIKGSDKPRQSFRDSWLTFYKGWSDFYEAHTGGPLAWASRAMNETMDQVQDYKKRVSDWQAAFASEGLMVPGPSPLVQREDKVQKYIILGSVIIVGGIVVYGLGRSALSRLFDSHPRRED